VKVVVAGTATEVGKTWATVALIDALRTQGHIVAARKPAQSFAPVDLGRTDAELLASASGEPVDVVCPRHRWYEVPMAPPMAADVLGRPPFTVEDLASEVAASWSAALDVGFVELAGGPRSPMATDGDGVDLARALAPDLVLLVADAGLGTINAVRLCIESLAPVAPVVVYANRYDGRDDLHGRNVAWLRDRDGIDVSTDIAALTSRLAPPSPTS
jgi:dethiobiotin synthetase